VLPNQSRQVHSDASFNSISRQIQQTYSTGVGPSFSSLFKKSSIKKDGKAADVAILSIQCSIQETKISFLNKLSFVIRSLF